MDDTQPQRRWYRLHWRTWIATVLVGITFVILQYDGLGLLQGNLSGSWSYSQSGWPLMSSSHSFRSYKSPAKPGWQEENTTRKMPVSQRINYVIVAAVIASTALVVERWCRRGRWFQIRPAGLLQTMASGTIVLVMFQNHDFIAEASWWNHIGIEPNLDQQYHAALEMLFLPGELLDGELNWKDIAMIFTDSPPDTLVHIGISTLLCVFFIAGIWCTVHASLLGLLNITSLVVGRVARMLRGDQQSRPTELRGSTPIESSASSLPQ